MHTACAVHIKTGADCLSGLQDIEEDSGSNADGAGPSSSAWPGIGGAGVSGSEAKSAASDQASWAARLGIVSLQLNVLLMDLLNMT